MTRWVVLLGLVVFSALAFADKNADKMQAEQLFRAGEQAFKVGKYENAADAFEQAYKLFSVPPIMFAAAQSHRLQYFIDKQPTRLKRAVELYRLYLSKVSEGGRRDDAATNLAELEPMLQRMEQSGAVIGVFAPNTAKTQFIISTVPSLIEGATAVVDGGKEVKLPHIPTVEPGKHTIQIKAPGYFEYKEDRIAVQGRIIPVEISLKPKPAKVKVKAAGGSTVYLDGRKIGTAGAVLDVESGNHLIAVTSSGRRAWAREVDLMRDKTLTLQVDQPRTTRRKTSYWVMGTAGATFIASGVFGGLAVSSYSKANTLEDKRNDTGLTAAELQEYNDLRDQFKSRRNLAYIIAGAGAVIGVTGFVLYWFDEPGPSEAIPVKYRPPTEDKPEHTKPNESADSPGIDSAQIIPTSTGDGGGFAVYGTF